MAAILSNHAVSLIYFSSHYANLPRTLKVTPYMKDKENGVYLFLLQLLLQHNPDISHPAVYLKTKTYTVMGKYVQKCNL